MRSPGDRVCLQLGIVADRIGWEERQLLEAARHKGASAEWIDDGRLCLGPGAPAPAEVVLLRSKSFVRGPLVARMLEDAGAQVVNSADSIRIAVDKLETLRSLHAAGIPTVDFRLVLTRRDLEAAIEQIGLPLVLKPTHGGFGSRVLVVREADLAHSVYDYVEFHARGFERALVAQPLVEGDDLRVMVVDGEPVCATRRRPSRDWRANVALGAVPERAEPDARVRAASRRVAALLGLEAFGLDLFDTAAGLLVGEVNHAPEFRGAAAATGVDIAASIVRQATAHLELVEGAA